MAGVRLISPAPLLLPRLSRVPSLPRDEGQWGQHQGALLSWVLCPRPQVWAACGCVSLTYLNPIQQVSSDHPFLWGSLWETGGEAVWSFEACGGPLPQGPQSGCFGPNTLCM